MADPKVLKAVEYAVRKAISSMGLNRFKQTSFFVSAKADLVVSGKKAA